MRAQSLALAAAILLLSAAPAARAELVLELPSQVYREQDESGKSQADPGRCDIVQFLEFPEIRRATSYAIVVTYPRQKNRMQEFLTAPPLKSADPWVLRFPPPKHFGRFFVGAYSTGAGCAAGLAEVEGSVVITESKVSLDSVFERRYRDVDTPPWKPAAKPGSRTVRLDLGLGDPRVILVRRQGSSTVRLKGERQPVNLMNNMYAEPGAIIRTGRDSVIKVGSLDSGNAVLVGPQTTIQITRTGLKVLDQPANPSFRVRGTRHGQDYKVRTNSSVLSARG